MADRAPLSARSKALVSITALALTAACGKSSVSPQVVAFSADNVEIFSGDAVQPTDHPNSSFPTMGAIEQGVPSYIAQRRPNAKQSGRW